MKKYKIVLISILIALCIEIFICNYGFFRTLMIGDLNIEPEYTVEDNVVIIPKIDSRVTSINFEYKKSLIDKVTYLPYYTYAGSSGQIEMNPKIILKNDKQYINFDTHTICKSITVERITESDLELTKIVLNHPNININLIRILLVFIVTAFIIKSKQEGVLGKKYDSNSKSIDKVFLLNLSVFCSMIAVYTICQFGVNDLFIKPEDIDKSNSIFMQTEAIVHGQIKLLEEPSEELKNMDNPYDYIKRDDEGIPYLYDVAYYNGNYYNYFGIAPVLTSILPFRLMTAGYLQCYIFNMLYLCIAIFALYFLYRKLIKRYVENISLCNFYFGFFAILFASNILTLLRGAKYDIVVSSGIAFILVSLNLAISIYESKKFKIPKLILLGITTAFIVLSKPNLIIYYLIILFFVLCSMKNLSKKEKLIDAIFIVVPLGAFAIFQMILNYVRFDNIFDFGAMYQLTGLNLASCMLVTFGKIYAGFAEYLFRLPTINPLKFPFVFANVDTSLVAINEMCYENRLVGLVALPILWVYLFKGHFVKETENKEFKWFINLVIIISVFAIIINTCFGGICETYSLDFKLLLSIGAVMLLLKWSERDENNNIKNKISMSLFIATIVIMLPISLTTECVFLSNFGSDISVFWKNLFEFWT